MKHDYDTTLARIAGNIAAGLIAEPGPSPYTTRDADHIAAAAVDLARRIVAQVKATEPVPFTVYKADPSDDTKNPR